MSIPYQHKDKNGNYVPVWMGKRVTTYDKWTANNNTYTIELTRTWEVDDNCMIEIANHGWEVGTYLEGHGLLNVISFLFKDTTNRSYLNIYDKMVVKRNGTLIKETYKYHYRYYTDINWKRQATYAKGTLDVYESAGATTPYDSYYFPMETGYLANEYCTFPQHYVYSAGNYTCTRWIMDPDFNNPPKTGAAVDAVGFRMGETLDSYLGFEPIRGYIWADKYVIEEYDSQGQSTGQWIATIPTSGVLLVPWGDYEGWSGFSWQGVLEMESNNVIDILYRAETQSWRWQSATQKWFWGGDVVIGPGLDTGAIVVYIPTVPQANSITEWLWSTKFVDFLQKIVQDPMECIVSFQAMYVPSGTITKTDTISFIVGNCDSGVLSDYTEDTLVSVDCGTCQINEVFHNVLDYDPYTKFEIFLPYVGFKSLKADDIMNSTLQVLYSIDIVTGTAVAKLKVTKEYGGVESTQTLYTFPANIAIQIPITGARYGNMVNGALGAVAGIAAAPAVGPAAPLVALGAAGVGVVEMAKHTVERSGGFSGNVGLLTSGAPYIIRTAPIDLSATNFEQYYGYATSQLALISACSGFTRCKEVKLSGITNATEREIDEIETLLKRGIYV